MNTDKLVRITLLFVCLIVTSAATFAQAADDRKEVFKGRLFAPNLILEHQDELALTKQQFTAIRAAVVEVQSTVAEHEWDLREAYIRVLADLDETPIDEDKVLENVRSALLAENQVKQLQVTMLIRLRNLLTDQQVEQLKKLQQR